MTRFARLLGLTLALASALAQPPELSNRVFDLAAQLRCPVCTSESVADSQAEVSLEMRRQISELINSGRSDAEVLEHFRARYGDWILLEPPRRGLHLIVWLLPLGAALFGALLLALVARRWLGRAREPLVADEADLLRVRQALQPPER